MCKCEQEQDVKDQAEKKKQDEMKRLEILKKRSLMDKNFEKCSFDNFEINETNRNTYNLCKKYSDSFKEMKENNIGLIMFGEPGVGKSFASFCIANSLLEQMNSVIAISSIGILGRIKDTYSQHGSEGEAEIIKSLDEASLLIIDDLGAENNTNWVKEKLYEIIDNRYRLKKPIIVTTNLTKQQLKDKLEHDGVSRTFDRLMEMCATVNIKGEKRREKQNRDKTKMMMQILNK